MGLQRSSDVHRLIRRTMLQGALHSSKERRDIVRARFPCTIKHFQLKCIALINFHLSAKCVNQNWLHNKGSVQYRSLVVYSTRNLLFIRFLCKLRLIALIGEG